MNLDEWTRKNPLKRTGIKVYAAELQQLKALGYSQDQMKDWLLTKGLHVSRQAIGKFFKRLSATSTQPDATSVQPVAPSMQPECNPSTNPSVVPQPVPGATLKERAQAVGDHYLQTVTSPLVKQLLKTKEPKT